VKLNEIFDSIILQGFPSTKELSGIFLSIILFAFIITLFPMNIPFDTIIAPSK